MLTALLAYVRVSVRSFVTAAVACNLQARRAASAAQRARTAKTSGSLAAASVRAASEVDPIISTTAHRIHHV